MAPVPLFEGRQRRKEPILSINCLPEDGGLSQSPKPTAEAAMRIR